MSPRNCLAAYCAGVVLSVQPAVASAAAGQVLFTLNRVEIERAGANLVAGRGTPVEVGDIVSVGPGGRAQIRMKDGALLALRPGTSLKIEDYYLPEAPAAAVANPAAQAPATNRGTAGRSVLRLLRGGLRTITGLIGKSQGDDYRFQTPVATLGIRGTTYNAAFCNGDCSGSADGLYVGVSAGGVTVGNDAGQVALNDGEYAFVKVTGGAPQLTTQLSFPQDTEEGSGDGEAGDDGAAGGGGDAAGPGGDPNALGGPAPQPAHFEENLASNASTARLIAHATGPLQDSSGVAGTGSNNSPPLRVDGDGGLTAFRGATASGIADYGIGTASNLDVGFASSVGLRWGRWSGGQAQIGEAPLDLSEQSLHWVVAAAGNSNPALPITGTATYQLIGNTNPTDNLGHVGFLGSATLSANFTDRTVASTLSLGVNNQVWTAAGSGSFVVLGAPVFAGNYSTVSVGGVTSGNTGNFAGYLSGPSGGVPTGAGLSYTLSSGTATVSGAAAFRNTSP